MVEFNQTRPSRYRNVVARLENQVATISEGAAMATERHLLMPDSTVAILMGTDRYQNDNVALTMPPLRQSYDAFKHYALSDQGLGIHSHNLMELFNVDLPSRKLLGEIREFLRSRERSLKQQRAGITDVVFYYVGFGAFENAGKEHVLVGLRTRLISLVETGLRTSALADLIVENAPTARQLVILDCDFASDAIRAWQGARGSAGPLAYAGFRTNVTARPHQIFLGSTEAEKVSITPKDGPHSMFTGALMNSLQTGDPNGGPRLSVDDVFKHMSRHLALQEGTAAVRPLLVTSSPPLSAAGAFPNPSWLRAPDSNDGELPAQQSPAPVVVELRNGRISKVRDAESILSADEADFNQWREAVLSHVGELCGGYFRQGTNHAGLRNRLLSLLALLPGDVATVKDRQFIIGYEIERLDRLVQTYRSAADDLPVLSTDMLEDVEHLNLMLKLGVGKLGRWNEFRNSVASDTTGVGSTSPNVVAAALDAVAQQSEAQPAYFDPELPASFRFLFEAVADPIGATETVISGAIRSIENLIIFLGQRALALGKSALDGVEGALSKPVFTAILLTLGTAATNLSSALPKAWDWLRPLLDAVSKLPS